MNIATQEIIDKLSSYTGGYDIIDGKPSFIKKMYTQEQDTEFKKWLFDRCWNDNKFRENFLFIPFKNRKNIERAIDNFEFYLPIVDQYANER